MPVAQKQATICEEGEYAEAEEAAILKTPLELTVLDEISDFFKKIKTCQDEERDDKRKLEKLSQQIDHAQKMIAKAEEKKEALLRKNKYLKESLENWNERTSKSLEYWQNYGIDVKQLSTDKDESDLYEFIYSGPSKFVASHQQEQQFGGSSGTKNESDNKYSVCIKFHDKQLQIVSQKPDLLNSDQISDLNSKLTDNCVTDTNVDYKSAMILIKKAYVKIPPP